MPAVVQTTGGYAANAFGYFNLPITSTAGNTLVLVMAGHIQANTWVPSHVGDDAGNFWQQVQSVQGSSNGSAQETCMAVFYCTNARAVTRLFCSFAGWRDVTGVAVQAFEVSGISNLTPIDSSGTLTTSGTTATLSVTTTNAADFVLGALVQGIFANTVSHTADSYTTTAEQSGNGGGGDTDDELRLNCAYRITSSSGVQSTSWTGSSTTDFAGIMVAFKGGSTSTANPNPNWPQLSAKLAFGTAPNAAGIGAYTYGTDVSVYLRKADLQYGIPFELGQASTGEGQLELYNQDGRFDHGNAGGPYFPNVLDYTPVQLVATWSGVQYGVFTGYVERWPQTWDDVLTGISPVTVIDVLGVFGKTKLKTCMQHEVLADSPWGYWPLNDNSKSRYAANLATGAGSQTVLWVQSPKRSTDATGDFGVQSTLKGDNSTVWGTQAPTPKNDAGWSLYTRVTGNQLPVPSSVGITVELWAQVPFVPQRNDEMTLFYLKSSAVAWSSHMLFGLQVDQISGSAGSTQGNLLFNYYDATGLFHQIDTGTRAYCDGRWHHFVLETNTSNVTIYVDDNVVYNQTLGTAISTAGPDTIDIGAEQDDWAQTDVAIGSFAHVAIYSGYLNATSIDRHWESGHSGFPEPSGARINRLLSYAGFNGPRLLDQGSSIVGPCMTTNGQFVMDALNDVNTWEFGLLWADGAGRIRFMSRANRFNQPVRGIFGDGPGEIHYQGDIQFDYDPTYQYNDIEAQRVSADSSTGQVFSSGDPSNTIQQYFTNSLQLSLFLLSDSQVQDRVNFLYSLLSVPQVRVAKLTLEPSHDPTMWAVALGLNIGDRYQVKRRPMGRSDTITVDVLISDVQHSIEPGKWATTVSTIAAVFPSTSAAPGPWLLNDPTYSVLGTSTVVGA